MKKQLLILCLGVSLSLAACGGQAEIAEVSSSQHESRAEGSSDTAQTEAVQSGTAQENTAQTEAAQSGTAQENAVQQKDLLEQFLIGDTAAEIDGDFVDLTQTFELDYSAGSSYTLNQLIGQLRKLDEYGMLGSKEPVITYAMLQNRPGEDDDE
ncbi:MAG: hypothetical protein IJV59_02040, partial [Eubacterium sp.]|nr:hypothetical protein [Eubacterium sp.]